MSAAFTPGPWLVADKGVAGNVCIMAADDVVVCELDGYSCDVAPDARLIAAAPKLHALVKESLYHLRLDDGAHGYHERVLAALAEIRGEQ